MNPVERDPGTGGGEENPELRRPDILDGRRRREMRILLPPGRASFLRVTVLGILAGALVILGLDLPQNELWAFDVWSSNTWGFWMFSVSLLVLYSGSRICAALHAGWYVFLLFFLTTVHQSAAMLHTLWRAGRTSLASLPALAAESLGGWLLYSVPPALLCAALGAVFWSGRKETAWGGFLRALPAAFLLGETLFWFCRVVAQGTGLFSALSDLVCLAVWPVLLSREFSPEPKDRKRRVKTESAGPAQEEQPACPEPADTEEATNSLVQEERRESMGFFRKWVIPVVGILEVGVLVLGVLAVTIIMKTEERVELARETSPDGKWAILITELGEPDWPFGDDHLQVQMWENTEDPKDSRYRVSFEADVANDGARASWEIRWLEDGVQVLLIGSEQPDALYELPYPTDRQEVS